MKTAWSRSITDRRRVDYIFCKD